MTTRHLYPGARHGFPMMADAAVSKVYTGDLMSALRRAPHPQAVLAAA